MANTVEMLSSPLTRKYIESMGETYTNGMVKITPSSCAMPAEFVEDLEKILDFEVKHDDIWLLTFPKCGTTWSQELVWLLMNDFDYELAKRVPLTERFPFLEITSIITSPKKPPVNSIEIAKNQKSPRLIKSHLPAELLPRKLWTVRPKIIYVTRGAKDVIASYYNHFQLWNDCKLTADEFAECFMEGIPNYTPFWKHILSFWNMRNESNVLLYSYEDMKKDLPSVIRKVSAFLERPVPDERLPALLEHLSFQQMRSNKSVNFEEEVERARRQAGLPAAASCGLTFMSSGAVGAGARRLSEAMRGQVDAWTDACLQGSGYDGPR